MASDVRPLKRLRTSVDEFENYDVFISHRGPDTKTIFVSFLYDGLECAGLRPFLDRVSIDKGEDSWSCIEHAIRTSPVAIIIFSEKYAQSEWCLKELDVILEIRGIKVLPVFYKVKPWEVRFPEKGRLANGFAKLMERHDATLIDQWRRNLEKASKLNGLEYEEGDKRLEKDLVKGIVERTFEWANKPVPLDVGEHAIGVDRVAQQLIERIDQKKSVLVLGLWGMGGIGKSTLARELYNCLRTRFAASTFVEDVTDKVLRGGIAKVQSSILEDLCKNESNGIKDKSRGKIVLEERLCMKKILVVLDDVCDKDGMEYLISCKMLSEGSMCIVTSRDKRLLKEAMSFDVTNAVYVHDVQGLNYEDSRRVFTSYSHLYGFKIDGPLEELVACITKACGGVPLVLKVCGALLKNEADMEVWKDVLKKLECGSIMDEEKIFGCLQISYDALQAQQKEMFLDIACALLGESKDLAVQVWRSQGWFASLGVRSLVEKALVIVDEDGFFAMHDHLRDMGRAIVKKEEVREGVTRRLWEPDSLKLLKSDESLPKFLQTVLISKASNDEMEDPPLQLDFSSLKELRIMRCCFNPTTTLSLPKNLLWFSCSQESLIQTSRSFLRIPQSSKLMILDLKYCNFETLCEFIGNGSSLEVMDLSKNGSLCWLPDSFGGLTTLRSLNLEYSGIKGLPDSFGGLRCLRTLHLESSWIEGLPQSFGSLSSLEDLDMAWCLALKKLPKSFGDLRTLRTLNLRCSGIEDLPESFGSLRSLGSLNVSECESLKKLPDSFGALVTLRTLDLLGSRIEGLPESFGCLRSLENLDVSRCGSLKKLPDSFGALATLRILDLWSSRIKGLPDSFGGLICLSALHLGSSRIEGLPESFGSLRSLEDLDMVWCSTLKKLPESFGDLKTLRTLNLQRSGIEDLPESFGSLSLLESLNVSECESLKKLPDSFGALATLGTLNLWGSGIEGLPESFGRLSSLENLDVSRCGSLKKLPDSFGALATLKTLILWGSGIEDLPDSTLEKLPESLGALEP